MRRGAAFGALLLALAPALLAGGCRTADYSTPAMPGPAAVPGATAMDGTWSSNDGVFIATFEAGTFTSRFTQTNEILAQGSYTVAGEVVNLQWISVATQQQRSAICAISAPDTLTCNQSGGGSFDLKRTA
jgi:hypothetical protein